MDLNLSNKVDVVTASSGMAVSIGHATVFALAREGVIPVLIN